MSSEVFKIIEIVGSSSEGTDDAIRNAVKKAATSVRHLRWFEVLETRGHIEGGGGSPLSSNAEGRLHTRLRMAHTPLAWGLGSTPGIVIQAAAPSGAQRRPLT